MAGQSEYSRKAIIPKIGETTSKKTENQPVINNQ